MARETNREDNVKKQLFIYAQPEHCMELSDVNVQLNI